MDSQDSETFLPESNIWTDKKQILNKIRSKVVIASTNVRSLKKNHQELTSVIEEIQPKAFCIQETWDPHLGVASIKGYDLLVKTRKERRGGGVGLYIDKGTKYNRLEDLDKLELKNLEIIGVRLLIKRQEVTLVSVYRAPDSKPDETIRELTCLLSKLTNTKSIIMGDLNINLLENNSKLKNDYLSTIMDNNFIQHVQSATRLTASSSTSIDHAISNIGKIEVFTTYHTVADHQLVLGILGKDSSKRSRERLRTEEKSTQSVDCQKTTNELRSVNWTDWINNTKDLSTNEMYDSFHETIQSKIIYEKKKSKKFIPEKDWMTREILLFKSEVDKAKIKFIKRPTESTERAFKQLRSTYRNLIQDAKHRYYANRIQQAGKNTAMTWKLIREILNRKARGEGQSQLQYNEKIIEDNLEAATIFSNHYKNAAMNKIRKLNSNREFERYLDNNEMKTDQFSLKEISIMDTWFYIKSVPPKLSSGFDRIPSKLMNSAASILARPLNSIINKSFKSGEFPDKLKMSKICPILKKGEPTPPNHRPVSLLSCFSKAIEKAAGNQLQKYMDEKLQNCRQYAYKAHHSTVHPILMTRHYIERELAKGKYVCLALIDLSLAFDTLECNHILPSKMKHYGVDNRTTKFFKSFFTDRKLYTEWNGVSSEPVSLYNHSCVQGSCLGPLAYNFYTQDLKNAVDSELVCFADDTNIIDSHRDPEALIKNMNHELGTVSDYMKQNTLILNKEKTFYILFKPKGTKKKEIKGKLYIDNTEIKQVDSARYLGIWFDEDLNFKKQYEMVYKKLEETTKALIATRVILNFKIKMLLYHSLFQSHLNYCSIAYQDKLSKGQVEKIYMLQKRAIRLIFRARPNSHTKNLFKLAKIIPFTRQYETEAIKFVFMNLSDTSRHVQPKAIQEILFKSSESGRNTRLHDDESKIKIHHEYKKGQAFYNIINEWNKTKTDHRMAGNLWSLKKMLKDSVLEELNICTRKNCTTCELDSKWNYERYMRRR